MRYNALTIDVEHWWCNEFLKRYLPEKREDQLIDSVRFILDILDKYNVRATFFVLGSAAEEHPEVLEMIYENGHEIGSHAYSHEPLYKLTREQFEKEIKQSIKIIHKTTGEKSLGFRAPHFSINNRTKWAFEILEKYGFKYDSSIFPIKTNLYGVPNAPLTPYHPSKEDVSKHDPERRIIEFPLSVIRLAGINIPISGGFYLRTFPLRFMKWALKKVSKERPAVIYIHPWEIYPYTPRLKASPLARFEAYHGTGLPTLRKFKALLKEFKFKPMGDIVDEL
ncbi:polysaccharide deacetylase [Thermococcus sp. EP1]|uniref:polysaccharide deacetylase family protein n=1 Tax=Thermococcus sp. EP1 TaxID=1591054 RepID=UPI0006DA98F1|nr:polysaccharide deacetylase family protein [Thermococcus sp. EP1]KPU63852.1 polysaccharide deacetylase [Thermococcus sp. EP1]